MCLGDYRQLAKILRTPPMFTDVLPLMLKPDEVELLLEIPEGGISVDELAEVLALPRITVETKIRNLFVKGVLKKKRDKKIQYTLKPFKSIVSRYLSEGRKDALGKFIAALADYRMDEHVKRAKADPYPEGRVLSIPEAVTEPVSIVLPYESAVGILEKARSISLRDCECRVTYGNCKKPLRTCLALNEFSDELVERKVAKKISLEEAKKTLLIANEHNLVHQALYSDWLKGEVYDLCSCCPCCCTYLRTYMQYGVKHHIAKSGLMAKVDLDKCNGCGICLERCIFQARKLEKGKSVLIQEKCYGCGLCTTTCPTGASKLVSAVS